MFCGQVCCMELCRCEMTHQMCKLSEVRRLANVFDNEDVLAPHPYSQTPAEPSASTTMLDVSSNQPSAYDAPRSLAKKTPREPSLRSRTPLYSGILSPFTTCAAPSSTSVNPSRLPPYIVSNVTNLDTCSLLFQIPVSLLQEVGSWTLSERLPEACNSHAKHPNLLCPQTSSSH